MNIDELSISDLRIEFSNLERENMELRKKLASIETRAVELVDEADELREMLGKARADWESCAANLADIDAKWAEACEQRDIAGDNYRMALGELERVLRKHGEWTEYVEDGAVEERSNVLPFNRETT